MNYFELFELPVSFIVDQNTLDSQYKLLQQKYHRASSVNPGSDGQAETLEKLTLLNKGFEILNDPDSTIRYVLEIKGLLPEVENYELPADFLIEVEELNTGLEDGDVLNIEEAETKVFQLQKRLYHNVQHIIDGYSEDTITEGQLLQVKDYYYRKKYLQGILETLSGMRNIAG